jgi:uncharacterized phage protein (TIGR01671 family)
MNRVIKFREKSVIDKKWMYGSFVLCTHNAIADICDIVADNDDTTQTPVLSYTVGQFTGLLDKNGKEIYEGDIITTENTYITPAIEMKGVVCFRRGQFMLCTEKELIIENLIDACQFHRATVIGNIHDNKELLKKRSNYVTVKH